MNVHWHNANRNGGLVHHPECHGHGAEILILNAVDVPVIVHVLDSISGMILLHGSFNRRKSSIHGKKDAPDDHTALRKRIE